MKLTNAQLKRIIKEELEAALSEADIYQQTKGSHQTDVSGILQDTDVQAFFRAANIARAEKGAKEIDTYPGLNAAYNVIDYGKSEKGRAKDKYAKNAYLLLGFLNQYLPAMTDGDDNLKQMPGYIQLSKWREEHLDFPFPDYVKSAARDRPFG